MIADQLSDPVWNAIADLVRRSASRREVYFAVVTKRDAANMLVWTKDFMDVPIPVTSLDYTFAYYDTEPIGDAVDGEPVQSRVMRREDLTGKNDNFKVRVVCPSVGDLVVILDPSGAKSSPVCVGLLRSKGAWEVDG